MSIRLVVVFLLALPCVAQINALRGRASISATFGGVSITQTSPLPSAILGSPYSLTLTATGGTAPYSWSLTSGSLCTGLSLSSGGLLSGTPTAAQTCAFGVTATDSLAVAGSKGFTLTVGAGGFSVGGLVKFGGKIAH